MEERAILRMQNTHLFRIVWGAKSNASTQSNTETAHWSVRASTWKLVSNKQGDLELYNLNDDIGESTDLAEQHPNKVQELHKSYQTWRNEMAPRIGQSD